jgi:hypothetical protein
MRTDPGWLVARCDRPNAMGMTIGASLCLIAVGAILKWAITAHVEGVNLQNMGVILMVVGGAGLALGLFLLTSARSRGIQPPPEI